MLAGLDTDRGYEKILRVMYHIVDSSQLTTSQRYDELKAADGWYDDEWANALDSRGTARTVHMRAAEGVKAAKALSIDMSPARQLVNIEPYEKSHSIVRGTNPHDSMDPRYHPFVQSSSHPVASTLDTIPDHLKNFIVPGLTLTPTNPLPAYMRDEVVVSRFPRSQEEDDDDETDG